MPILRIVQSPGDSGDYEHGDYDMSDDKTIPQYCDMTALLRSNIKERYSDPIKYAAAEEIERLERIVLDELDGLRCELCKRVDTQGTYADGAESLNEFFYCRECSDVR